MTDTYQTTPEPAAAPPPAAPPPSYDEPQAPPGAPLGPVRNVASTYNGESYDEHGAPKIHQGVETATRELIARRGQRPHELEDELGPEGSLIEMKFVDGRPADEEIDARDAASRLTGARAEMAEREKYVRAARDADPQGYIARLNAEALAQVTGEQPAAEGQVQQQPAVTPLAQLEAERDRQLPELQSRLAEIEAARNEHISILRSLGAEVPDAPEQIAAQQAQQIALQYAQAHAQAREQHEFALTKIVADLTGANLAEFADLRTESDLQKLAQTDVMKFNRFRALQTNIHQFRSNLNQLHGAQQQQYAQQQQQAAEQFKQQFKQYVEQQDKRVAELVPEMHPSASPQTREALQRASIATLEDAGFNREEIVAAWQGGMGVNLRDARAQKILAKAAKWDMAQAAKATAMRKPVPAVQRPGVSTPRYVHQEVQQQNLSNLLDRSSSSQEQLRLGAQMLAERRRNTAR